MPKKSVSSAAAKASSNMRPQKSGKQSTEKKPGKSKEPTPKDCQRLLLRLIHGLLKTCFKSTGKINYEPLSRVPAGIWKYLTSLILTHSPINNTLGNESIAKQIEILKLVGELESGQLQSLARAIGQPVEGDEILANDVYKKLESMPVERLMEVLKLLDS